METLTTTTTSLTADEAAVAGAAIGGMIGAAIIGILIFYIFTVIATWKIFEKAGESGWKAIIPIYNLYIMFKIVNMSSWFWFVLCVGIIAAVITSINSAPSVYVSTSSEIIAYSWTSNPVVLITTIVECIIYIWAGILYAWRLSKVFGHGVGYFIGNLFLPNIFWLILGFGKSKYNKKLLNK